MIKSKLVILLFLILPCPYITLAQSLESRNYVILTVEVSFSKGFEGTKKYYWIIERDSISTSRNNFCPLILSGFSEENLDKCCRSIAIDPFVFVPSDSVFDIGAPYFQEVKHLEKLVLLKRRQTFQIVKKWTITQKKELITFYLSPITGRFCNSEFAKTGQWRTGYTGKVYIPYSSFETNSDFWNSSQSSILSNIDFISLDFNSVR